MDGYLILNRMGGGRIILLREDIGIMSSDISKLGSEEPEVLNESRTLIYVKSIGASVVVEHPIDEMVSFLNVMLGLEID